MIGFIGLGIMGEPILGYDLDPAPLARLKIEAAKSVQEIAERCDTVFFSLPRVDEVKLHHRPQHDHRRPRARTP